MKKIISLVICMCFIVSTFVFVNNTVSASTFNGFSYYISDGNAIISGCDSSVKGDIVIPSTINGYTVVGIGDSAFYDPLRNENTNFISVTIPNSVINIGDYAFCDCINLSKVTLGDGLKTIGKSAFDGCKKLSEIILVDGIKTIREYAFVSCAIESINIPKSVTSIGEFALYCYKLESITVDEKNENYCSEDGVLFNKDKTKIVQYPTSRPNESYVIPDTVTSIGGAFRYCNFLTELTIGNGINTIEDYSFSSCETLAEVIIPDSVTSIGKESFYFCRNLTNLSFGKNIKTIGESAFAYCRLNSLIVPDSVTEIGNYAFYACSTSIATIGRNVKSIGKEVFSNCTALTNVKFHNSTTVIGENAFYYCNKLSNIEGHNNSSAKTYASANKKTFISICEHSLISVKESTCTTTGKRQYMCNGCGYSHSEIIEKKQHIASDDWEIIKQPSCFENGQKLKRCVLCNLIVQIESILSTHSPIYDCEKEATCTETGLTEGSHCSVCGEIFVAQQELPKLPHKYNERVGADSTYFEKGIKVITCSECGEWHFENFEKKLLNTPNFNVTTSNNSLTVNYKKVKDSTGFQVEYKTKSTKKTLNVNTLKNTSKVISNLKRGEYSVRIRSFIKKDGKTAYSKWSERVSVFVNDTLEISTTTLNVDLKGSAKLNATTIPKKLKVSWSSSNKKIATVNSKGKIKGISNGKATITAKITYKGKIYSKKCNVKVFVLPKFNVKSITMFDRSYSNLKVVSGSGTIKWSSSDNQIATVDSKGKISAVKSGSCYIIAVRNKVEIKCKVVVSKFIEDIEEESRRHSSVITRIKTLQTNANIRYNTAKSLASKEGYSISSLNSSSYYNSLASSISRELSSLRSRYYSISSKPGYASEAAALKREINDLEDEYSTCLNLKNAAKKYEEYESYISEANRLSKNEPKKHEVNVIAICREYGVDNYEKYL